MSQGSRDIVEAGYDSMALAYLKYIADIKGDPRLRFLTDFQAHIPRGSPIADLGCGAGEPCTRLLAQNHDVTGIDISTAQIELAKASIPGATFLKADLSKVTFPSGSVDGVTAFYSLTHLPRDEHAEVFEHVADWLKPDGYFLLSLSATGDSNGMDDDFVGVPMYFSGYAPEINRSLLQAAGFDLVTDTIVAMEEPGGSSAFQWILARKGIA